jgi:uncharacterized protein YkwD
VTGAVIFDLLAVGAILAFAWGATQLGGLTALARLFEAIVAFGVAALLRDPVGEIIEALTGFSIDLSRLVGMLLVGLATWLAAHRVYKWWRGRRDSARLARIEDEALEYDEIPDDLLDTPNVARLAGALIGVGWVALFTAMLVLQPSNTPVSRAAIASWTGGTLIHGGDTLKWLREGFPHYTQTLPKGTVGAVVGEQDGIDMRAPTDPRDQPGDADPLLQSINQLRRNSRAPVLTFNPEVAGVARRHASSLVDDQLLSYASAGGGGLGQRVQAALGETSGAFSEDVGTEVVWAHDPDTAMRGLLDSARATRLLEDPRWREIGIGVATTEESGWFNGRIYVLLLVGVDEEQLAEDAEALEEEADLDAIVEEVDGEESGTTAPAPGDTGAGDDLDAAEVPTSEECTPAGDLDGDGVPDAESVDPALVDCDDLE